MTSDDVQRRLRFKLPPALRSSAFTRTWIGSIVSSTGTQMNIVAAGWVLYRMTGSTIPLAVQGLCFSIPIAILPLIAGPLVDRLDRFTVIKATLILEAGTAGCLALLSALGALHPIVFYVAAALDASRLAFTIPAQTAITPVLVPGEHLLSAQSLGMTVWSSSSLIGPAVGGLLLAQTGPSVVFAINALATLVALGAIWPLRTAQFDTSVPSVQRLTDGFRYVLRHRWVLAVQLILACTSTLAIAVETLLPALVVSHWHSSSVDYGLLRAAPGVAALATGLSMSLISKVPKRPLPLIGGGLLATAGGVCVFTQAATIQLAWLLLAITALAITVTQIVTSTHLQRHMPKQFLGVLGGLNAISQSGVPGIGAAVTAGAANTIGSGTAILAAVAIMLPVSALALGYLHRSGRYQSATAG